MVEEQGEGFFSRLAKAQAEFVAADLDAKNPYIGYSYASYGSLIEAVRPALGKYGIAVLHSVVAPEIETQPAIGIRTMLVADDGRYDTGVVSVPVTPRFLEGGRQAPVDAQAYGAAITYAKRYGLELALGIGREDTDSVDQRPQPAKQRPARSTQTQKTTAAQHDAAIMESIKRLVHEIKDDQARVDRFLELFNLADQEPGWDDIRVAIMGSDMAWVPGIDNAIRRAIEESSESSHEC